MRLNSSAFADGAAIPRHFTCDGEDVSPAFDWSDPPAPTRSFVLLCDDPDAPGGVWHHWAVYDIPANQRGLAEGAVRDSDRKDFKQAINDFRRPGYGGPCPPRGHGFHHYHFRLLALSCAELGLPGTPTCKEVAQAAIRHTCAEAILIGLYERR